MSDDIVKKFQEAASQYYLGGGGAGGLVDWEKDVKYPGGPVKITTGTQREAEFKARIEQLEAALQEIVAMTPDPEFGTPPIESAIKVARAALGEHK